VQCKKALRFNKIRYKNNYYDFTYFSETTHMWKKVVNCIMVTGKGRVKYILILNSFNEISRYPDYLWLKLLQRYPSMFPTLHHIAC